MSEGSGAVVSGEVVERLDSVDVGIDEMESGEEDGIEAVVGDEMTLRLGGVVVITPGAVGIASSLVLS